MTNIIIREIINFNIKYISNLIKICNIENDIKRKEETIKYIILIDQTIDKICNYGTNNFKKSFQKYKLMIINNLNNCSFQNDKNERNKLCRDFLEKSNKNLSKISEEYS